MKNQSVRRDVASTPPPDHRKWLRKVPRAPKSHRPGRRRKTRPSALDWNEARGEKSKGEFPVAWMVLLGVLTTLGIGTAVIMNRPAREESPLLPTLVADNISNIAPVSSGPTPISEKDALELVRKALDVREPSKVEELMITGSASSKEIVEFLKALPEEDGKLEKLTWMTSMDANALPLEGVTLFFNKDGEPRNRLALLTPDEAGKWRMDFEAFARRVNPSWDVILKNSSAPAVVRVFLAHDSYYNGIFSDDGQWVCLGLASPDVDQLLFGYCKVGSAQETAIKRLLKDSRGAVRAVVKIQRPEGASPRQFEIIGVIAHDWVRGPIPLDEK